MYTPENKFTEAHKLLSNARVFLQTQEVAKANALLVQIVRQYPEFGKAWYELGNITLLFLEDVAGAEECYKTAIEVEPNYTPAYLAYADVLFQTGQYAEMNAVLNQVIELNGVRKDLVLRKNALLFESQKRFDEAIVKYIEALMNCFDDNEVDLIEKGIGRCQTKKKYL